METPNFEPKVLDFDTVFEHGRYFRSTGREVAKFDPIYILACNDQPWYHGYRPTGYLLQYAGAELTARSNYVYMPQSNTELQYLYQQLSIKTQWVKEEIEKRGMELGIVDGVALFKVTEQSK